MAGYRMKNTETTGTTAVSARARASASRDKPPVIMRAFMERREREDHPGPVISGLPITRPR